MGPPVHEGYPATTQPALTSGEGSGRTLLRASTIFIFLGQLKCCPYCCTFLRSFSLRGAGFAVFLFNITQRVINVVISWAVIAQAHRPPRLRPRLPPLRPPLPLRRHHRR